MAKKTSKKKKTTAKAKKPSVKKPAVKKPAAKAKKPAAKKKKKKHGVAAAAAPQGVTKITELQTLQRTKKMLKREWKLGEEPASNKSLRDNPPGGLGKNSAAIRALEGPIETKDFKDVNAQVTGSGLEDAETVGELSDVIWKGIPAAHK